MFKRIIIGLFTISVVALLWAPAHAQTVGPYNCVYSGVYPWYLCDYYVWCSGKWVKTPTWVAWTGGSGSNEIQFKAADPDVNKCDRDDITTCPTTESAMFGTVDPDNPVVPGTPSDTNDVRQIKTLSYTALLWGKGSKINPKCTRPNPPPYCDNPPGDTPGQPGDFTGYSAVDTVFEDCSKPGMCKASVPIAFDVDCPNQHWYCDFVAGVANVLTCEAQFGYGWLNRKQPAGYPPILVACPSLDRVNYSTDATSEFYLPPDLRDLGFKFCKKVTYVDYWEGKPSEDPKTTHDAYWMQEKVTAGYCWASEVWDDNFEVGTSIVYDCNFNNVQSQNPYDPHCTYDGDDCYVGVPDPDKTTTGNGPLTFCSDLYNRSHNPDYAP